MEEYLKFRKMITPIVIQVLFWIGIAAVEIGGIIAIVFGIAANNLGAVFAGLLYMLLGPILVRVYCEVIIVLFRILDVLGDIKRNTERAQ